MNNKGRLEVYHNGTWGRVCCTGFDNIDAGVVCNSLGFGFVSVQRNSFQNVNQVGLGLKDTVVMHGGLGPILKLLKSTNFCGGLVDDPLKLH